MVIRLFCCLSVWQLLILECQGQTDDFDDGNDEGWSRLDFVGQALGSSYGLFQVQSGQYRLSSLAPPEPGVGVARVASYRPDKGYGTFLNVVDAVSWNQALDQTFGLLGRIQGNPQPGTLSGYSLTYRPQTRVLAINRLDGEVAHPLASSEVSLPPGDSYRFVFSGMGRALTAAVYNLNAPLQPLATLSAEDGAFWAGYGGLLAVAEVPDGAVNVTFDSYAAGPGGVPRLEFAAEAGLFTAGWPRLTAAWHLESSRDLSTWTAVREGGFLSGGQLKFSAPVSGQRFYRLAAGW